MSNQASGFDVHTWLAAGLVVLGAGLSTRLGDGVALASYDTYFLLRDSLGLSASRAAPEPGVRIVYFDLDQEAYWDDQKIVRRTDGAKVLSRKEIASLLRKITQGGARSVIFDLRFGPGYEPAHETAELAQAIRSQPAVVLAVTGSRDAQRAPPDPQGFASPMIGIKSYLDTIDPVLEAAAGAVGLAQFDVRGARRQVRHFSAVDERWLLTAEGTPEPVKLLSWAAAEINGADLPSVARLAGRPLWLNHYGPPKTLAHYSLAQVRAMDVEQLEDAFSNRVVFVGREARPSFGGEDRRDDFATPYTRLGREQSAGVEIQATAFSNLLRKEWLARLPRFWEAALLGACGLGLACVPRLRLRSRGFLLLLPFLVVPLAATLAIWASGVWFSWLVLAGVQWPLVIAVAVWHRATPPRGKGDIAVLPPLAASMGSPAGRPASMRPEADLPAQEGLDLPDFELVRRIGRGGFGEVWLARGVLGTYRAVKTVRAADFSSSRAYESEFEGIRRYDPLSRKHPGLVDVLHVGRDDSRGFFYYVMELADSQEAAATPDTTAYQPRTLLSEWTHRGRLPTAECVDLGIALAGALGFLHQHDLVHRDVKLGNVIFVGGAPKLADIGLVRPPCQSVTYVGTEGYLPPEGPGSCQADIFALGKVLYEMATGKDRLAFKEFPDDFDRMDPAEQELFWKLFDVISHACADDRSERFRTAKELEVVLRSLRASENSTRFSENSPAT